MATEDLRLAPSAMVAGGAALARDGSGRVVFVEGALPGEVVTVRMTESRVDYGRASVVTVLEPSPERVSPPCPALSEGCGGCTWQHIAPAAQLQFKAGIVVDALRRIGRFAEPPVPVHVALEGPALRTTARLAVSPGGRAGYRPWRGNAGARAVGSDGHRGPERLVRFAPHNAVETDSCLAAHPRLEELITAGRYPGATEVLARVGAASGDRVVKIWPAEAAAVVHLPDGVAMADAVELASFRETIAGRQFRVSIDSFFQPGPVAAAGLVAGVTEAIGDALAGGGHLVDAYAGVGLFASVIGARTGAPVIAIESDSSARADARANLGDLDARVIASDVGRWRPQRGDRPVAALVADPPRPGLGRPGVAAVVSARAPTVVLVSCDPASLARDGALLRDRGYNLESVAMVDAFPHTFHVETVSRFERQGR